MLTIVVCLQLCVTFEALEENLLFHHCFVMAWASNFRHMNLMNAVRQIVSKKSAMIGVVHESIQGIERDHREICRIQDETNIHFEEFSRNAESWTAAYLKSIDVSDR